jgi:hypothetical protein
MFYCHQGSQDGPKVRNGKLNVLEADVSSEEGAAAGLAGRQGGADGVRQVEDGLAGVVGAEMQGEVLESTSKSGVDVTIAIFCDFSAKKLAFFSKTNAIIKFCIIYVLRQNANFSQYISRKCFKNHNIDPWSQPLSFIAM